MAAIRAQYQEFADLPAYTGSSLPTEARDIVTRLTELPSEDYIQSLDTNVEACEWHYIASTSFISRPQACLQGAFSKELNHMARRTGQEQLPFLQL